jgi:hypothetical protein
MSLQPTYIHLRCACGLRYITTFTAPETCCSFCQDDDGRMLEAHVFKTPEQKLERIRTYNRKHRDHINAVHRAEYARNKLLGRGRIRHARAAE